MCVSVVRKCRCVQRKYPVQAVPILIPIGALGDQYEEAIKLIQQYSGIKLKQATE